MSDTGAVGLYAALALMAAFVQLALVLGLPWGLLTMGGRWSGRLPPGARALAALQCVLLVAMGAIMLSVGGVVPFTPPAWVLRATLVLTVMAAISNATTPSRRRCCSIKRWSTRRLPTP